MSIGALAFMLSMISLAFVFFGYALYQHNHKEKPAREPVRRRVVLLFFGLYIGAIILAAGIPGYAIAYFGSPIWLKLLSLPTGLVYFIFGLVMLWLSMQAYEHLALE